MTTPKMGIASLTNAQLADRFIADGRRMGNPLKPFAEGNMKAGTPEFVAAGNDLKAISRELRARNVSRCLIANMIPCAHSRTGTAFS